MEVGYLSLTGGLREFCTHILAQLQGESGQACISLNATKSYFLHVFCSHILFPILLVLLVFMLCF